MTGPRPPRKVPCPFFLVLDRCAFFANIPCTCQCYAFLFISSARALASFWELKTLTHAQAAIWARLSQPKARRQDKSAVLPGPDSALINLKLPEPGHGMISRTRSDPGPRVEGPDVQADVQAARALPCNTSVVGRISLKMKLKTAIKLSLHATRFRRAVSEWQDDIDEARSKADAWLNRQDEEVADNQQQEEIQDHSVASPSSSRRGLRVGVWPSRFGRWGRRRSSVTTVLDSSLKIETNNGTYSLSSRGSLTSKERWFGEYGAGSRRGSTPALSCDAEQVPSVLLGLMYDKQAPKEAETTAGAGDLSPATRRYLPGCGKKWVRTKQKMAVRLSQQGSGDYRSFFATKPWPATGEAVQRAHEAIPASVDQDADTVSPFAAYTLASFSRVASAPCGSCSKVS